jgi:hypothetical protein
MIAGPKRQSRVGLAKLVLSLAIGLGIGSAGATDSLLADLEQRLSRSGVESVNAYLNSHWAAAMQPLNEKTASCELHAVSLAVTLSRGSNARRARHGESAAGRRRWLRAVCLGDGVARRGGPLCASVSSWGPAQTARELRRRIGDIDADALLRSSQRARLAARLTCTSSRTRESSSGAPRPPHAPLENSRRRDLLLDGSLRVTALNPVLRARPRVRVVHDRARENPKVKRRIVQPWIELRHALQITSRRHHPDRAGIDLPFVELRHAAATRAADRAVVAADPDVAGVSMLVRR